MYTISILPIHPVHVTRPDICAADHAEVGMCCLACWALLCLAALNMCTEQRGFSEGHRRSIRKCQCSHPVVMYMRDDDDGV